jgi:hypothetical protein
MTSRPGNRAFVVAALLAGAALHCDDSPTAGGQAPAPVAAISGTLFASGGAWVSGAAVCLLPCDYVPTAPGGTPRQLDSPADDTTAGTLLRTTTTDAEGRYLFEDVGPGCYNIEARLGVLAAFVGAVTVPDSFTSVQVDDTLRAYGSIAGIAAYAPSVELPKGDMVLYVTGTTLAVRVEAPGLFALLRVPEGSYVVTLMPSDSSFGPASVSVTVTGLQTVSVDTLVVSPRGDPTAPPAVLRLTPADEEVGVGVYSRLAIAFTEPVVARTGNIRIKRFADDMPFEVIPVTDARVTGSGTSVITIDPHGAFAPETEYYVQVPASGFEDLSGHAFVGFLDNTTWNFRTGRSTCVPPLFTAHPAETTVAVGALARFTVSAVGTELSFQWHRGLTPIAGATDTAYELVTTVADDHATLWCLAENACGCDTSKEVVLTVVDTGQDSTAPVILSLSPSDDAIDVSANADLVITFSEPVVAVTDTVWIRYTGTGVNAEAVPVADGSRLQGSGSAVITVNPATDLSHSTGYFVTIPPDAFDDTAGNSFAGLSDTTAWNFTTADQ